MASAILAALEAGTDPICERVAAVDDPTALFPSTLHAALAMKRPDAVYSVLRRAAEAPGPEAAAAAARAINAPFVPPESSAAADALASRCSGRCRVSMMPRSVGIIDCPEGLLPSREFTGGEETSALCVAVAFDDAQLLAALCDVPGADVNVVVGPPGNQSTPLRAAVLRGDAGSACMRVLLDKGATDSSPTLLLDLAIAHGVGEEGVDALLLALRPNLLLMSTVDKSPLMYTVAVYGNAGAARALLRAGADRDARNGAGFGPLAATGMQGYASTAEALIEAGADPNGRHGPKNFTPLMEAAVNNGGSEYVRVMVALGAEVDAVDMYGRTPLMLAATYDQVETLEALLDAGADPFKKDVTEEYALWSAAAFGFMTALKILVERGSPEQLEWAVLGATPYAAAKIRGHKAVAAYLLELGADPSAMERVGASERGMVKTMTGGDPDYAEALRSRVIPVEVGARGDEGARVARGAAARQPRSSGGVGGGGGGAPVALEDVRLAPASIEELPSTDGGGGGGNDAVDDPESSSSIDVPGARSLTTLLPSPAPAVPAVSAFPPRVPPPRDPASPVGYLVRIQGLLKSPLNNGLEAVVEGRLGPNKRHKVRLLAFPDQVLEVRPENLIFTSGAVRAPESAPATVAAAAAAAAQLPSDDSRPEGGAVLQTGALVRIRGLVKAAQYNGMLARVLADKAAGAGRILVQLVDDEDEQVLEVRPKNLESADADPVPSPAQAQAPAPARPWVQPVVPASFYAPKSPADLDAFPRAGITLRGIRDFIALCGGPETLAGKSTADVSRDYVVPFTKVFACSYADMKTFVQSPDVGPATVFVSHAWGDKFLDAVDALESWQARQPAGSPAALFWLDIFVNSQHNTQNRPFSWWSTTFLTNVGDLAHTLLVLQWEKPTPLTRAWCIWELYSTVKTKARLEVIMCRKEERAFHTALQENFESLVSTTCTVDVRNATAFLPSDKDAIFESIRESIGFDRVNQTVIGQLKTWMYEVGRETLNRLPAGKRLSSPFAANYARMLQDDGRYAEAEEHFKDMLEASRTMYGPTHGNTLACIANIANAVASQGRNDEAEALHRQAYELKKTHLGPDHAETLTSANLLGSVLQDLGRFDEAREYFEVALEGRRRTLGDDHPSTVISLVNMGVFLSNTGRHADAIKYTQKAYDFFKSRLGPTHPHTLQVGANLATAMHNLEAGNDNSSATADLETATLRTTRTVLGDRSMVTLTAINMRAVSLKNAGRHAEALKLFTEAHTGLRETFGECHLETLISACNLSQCLKDLRQLKESEELMRHTAGVVRAENASKRAAAAAAAAGSTGGAGAAVSNPFYVHPGTDEVLSHFMGVLLAVDKVSEAAEVCEEVKALRAEQAAVGSTATGSFGANRLELEAHRVQLLLEQEKFEEAEVAGRASAAAFVERFGAGHRNTIPARVNLGCVLHKLGKLDEAEEIFREVLAVARAVTGPTHDLVQAAMFNFVQLLRDKGGAEADAECEALAREAYAGYLAVSGAGDFRTVGMARIIGQLCVEHGERVAEAAQFLRAAADGQRVVHGPTSPEYYLELCAFGPVAHAAGLCTEAAAALAEARDGFRAHKSFGPAHELTVSATFKHAVALLDDVTVGIDVREAVCREALDAVKRHFGPLDEHTLHLQSAVDGIELRRIRESVPGYKPTVARGSLRAVAVEVKDTARRRDTFV
jgi:ankyrin repeat protein/tetratricopeptide (TPR) repeat protein